MKVQNIVHTSTYKTKDGVEKKKYITVGSLMTWDDGGMSIKLDSIPVGFDGKLAVYDRDENRRGEPNVRTDTSRYKEQGTQIGEAPNGAPVVVEAPSLEGMDELPF